MATTIGDLQFIISAQTASLKKAQADVNQLKESLRKAAGANSDFSNVGKQVESGVLRQVKAFQSARDTIIRLRQKIDELNKAGADTAVISGQMDRAYGRLRSQLEKGIITQTKLNTEMDLFKRQASTISRSIDQLGKSAKNASDGDLKALNQRMTDLATSVQIALGPLSGVASRITAIASLANRNTAAIAGLVGGLIAFTHAAVASVKSGQDLQTQMLVIENRVNMVGKAIGFTTDQLADMADELARTTMMTDDEARAAIINLTEATNLAGKSFERALKTAADLSATGFGDLASQAQTLAKILDEPAEGMDRLRRMGIFFTDRQKEVIQTLQDTGRHAEAAGILLDAINKKVGGNAEAAAKGSAGAWHRLAMAIDDAAEGASKASGMQDKLASSIDGLTSGIKRITEQTDSLEKFGGLVSSVFTFFIDMGAAVVNNIEMIGGALAGVFAASVITNMGLLISGLKKIAALAGISTLFASWPILLAASVGALVGFLAKLNLLDDVWKSIKGTIEQIGINIQELWKTMGGGKVIDDFKIAIGDMFEAIDSYFQATPLEGVIGKVFEKAAKDVKQLGSVIGETGKAFGEGVSKAVEGSETISGIKQMAGDATAAVKNALKEQEEAAKKTKDALTASGKELTGGSVPEVDAATFAFSKYTDALKEANFELLSLRAAAEGVDPSVLKLANSIDGLGKDITITGDGIKIVNKTLQELNQSKLDQGIVKDVFKLIDKKLPAGNAITHLTEESKKLAKAWTELYERQGWAKDPNFHKGLLAIENSLKIQIDLFNKPKRALDDQVKTLDAQAKALEKSEKELFVINELLKVDVAGLKEMGLTAAEIAAEMDRLRVSAEGAFDQKERIKQMKSAMQELSSLMERSFDRIGSAITEMFLRGKDEAISFKNVMKAIGSEIAQFFIQLAVVNPIKNMFLSQFGGSQAVTLNDLNAALASAGVGRAGLTSGQSNAILAQGGSGGGVGSLFSLSGLLSGLSTGGAGLFATNIAAKLGLGNTGQMIAGNAFSSLGYGVLGSLGANLFGLGGGVGGGVGGTAGTLIGSAFGGPIGAGIGGFLGSAIGGLFGGGISRQTGGATVNSATGLVTSQGGKGDTGDFAKQLASGMQDALSKATKLIGADLASNLLAVRTFANSDKFKGQSPFTLFGEGFNNRVIGNFSSEQDLLQKGVLSLLRDPKFVQNVPKEFQQALSQSTTLDQFLQMAQEIKEVTEALGGLADTLLNITPFGQQIKELTTNFQSLRTNASLLGLTLADINKAELFHLNSLQLDIANAINSIPDQARSLLGIDTLQAFRDSTTFGALSPGSPVDKFSAVRASFDQIAQAALAGDQSAIAKLPGIANEALTQGRDVFASGPAFAEFFRTVTSTFDQVIANQQNLADESGVDLDFTIRETTQLQLAAMKELQTQLSKDLQDVRRAIDRNRAR